MSLRLGADISITDTGEGMVLLDKRKGLYWQLNSSGAVVLRALVDGGSAEAAVRALTERFPSAAGRVAADVTTLIKNLRTAGLVT